MQLDIDSYFGVHAKALQVREQRSALIASNLANIDTPNFKAKDVDFKQVLQQFSTDSVSLKTDNNRHLKSEDNMLMAYKFRRPSQVSLDGNTVDKDVETTEFARNAIQYQASLNFLNSKIHTMKMALKGE